MKYAHYYVLTGNINFDCDIFAHQFFFNFFFRTYHHCLKTDFFEVWVRNPKEFRNDELFRFVVLEYDLSGVTGESLRNLKVKIFQISKKIAEKWISCGKNKERFLVKFSEWLKRDTSFTLTKLHAVPSGSRLSKPGRPQKEFNDSSVKTKRRRVADLINARSASQLVYAAEVSTRSSGNKNAAQIIKKVGDRPEMDNEKKKVLQIVVNQGVYRVWKP